MAETAPEGGQQGPAITLKSPFQRKTDVFDAEDFDPTKFVNQIYPDGAGAPGGLAGRQQQAVDLAAPRRRCLLCWRAQRHPWATWTSSSTCCASRWDPRHAHTRSKRAGGAANCSHVQQLLAASRRAARQQLQHEADVRHACGSQQ